MFYQTIFQKWFLGRPHTSASIRPSKPAWLGYPQPSPNPIWRSNSSPPFGPDDPLVSVSGSFRQATLVWAVHKKRGVASQPSCPFAHNPDCCPSRSPKIDVLDLRTPEHHIDAEPTAHPELAHCAESMKPDVRQWLSGRLDAKQFFRSLLSPSLMPSISNIRILGPARTFHGTALREV